MYRYNLFAPNEHYHILGRGNYKQNIFLDEKDYSRFLFLLLHFQLPRSFDHMSREVKYFGQHRVLTKPYTQKELKKRNVELVNFCLMPNHFHLTIKEVVEGGISKYMQRVLNGFTKYHNTKHEKKGHLFEGPFKAVHIESNEQLLYLSAYIHRNPRELKRWRRKEHIYPWSSYQDYIRENRWGTLLVPDLVLGQFKSAAEYRKFTDESGAKEFEHKLEIESLNI